VWQGGTGLVGTVGDVRVWPGASNVIPGRVRLGLPSTLANAELESKSWLVKYEFCCMRTDADFIEARSPHLLRLSDELWRIRSGDLQTGRVGWRSY
jgi:hypothetical protein